MTRCQTIGGIVAFVLFQIFGRKFFPSPPGPEFKLSWEQMIAVLIVTFIGVGIGHVIGKLVEPSKADS